MQGVTSCSWLTPNKTTDLGIRSMVPIRYSSPLQALLSTAPASIIEACLCSSYNEWVALHRLIAPFAVLCTDLPRS
jgi:hypothetical protein